MELWSEKKPMIILWARVLFLEPSQGPSVRLEFYGHSWSRDRRAASWRTFLGQQMRAGEEESWDQRAPASTHSAIKVKCMTGDDDGGGDTLLLPSAGGGLLGIRQSQALADRAPGAGHECVC